MEKMPPPVYLPDSELSPDQLAARQIARAEAAVAAESNAKLTFNPTTGGMDRVDEVMSDIASSRGEQKDRE